MILQVRSPMTSSIASFSVPDRYIELGHTVTHEAQKLTSSHIASQTTIHTTPNRPQRLHSIRPRHRTAHPTLLAPSAQHHLPSAFRRWPSAQLNELFHQTLNVVYATACASSRLSPSTHHAPMPPCGVECFWKDDRIRRESPPEGMKGG